MMIEMKSPVLVIDDDQEMRWALRTILGTAGVETTEAHAGAAGLEVAALARPAAVLLDLRMPGLSGEEVIVRLRRMYQTMPVIVVTGYGSISSAVDAIRAGAFDYLTKPFNNDDVISAVKRAVASDTAQVADPDSSLSGYVTGLMGSSPAILNLISEMRAVAETDYSVLICGETGAGKEIVAQALHRYSARQARPFVVLDCGAVAGPLVNSEFFGHERGAFTGAHERRRGCFELAANGGTVFLDEIGNLCMSGQQALLRALEERIIHRVGGTAPVNLDVRIVSATNEHLDDDGGAALFRSDLYYRLSDYIINLPPLRARPEDIEFLANRFLRQAQPHLGAPAPEFSADALDVLRDYHWPGNVRQLRNVARRVGLKRLSRITAEHVLACMPHATARTVVPMPNKGIVASAADAPFRDLVQNRVMQVEREVILGALTLADGNKAKAARHLQIGYKTFRTKLKTVQQSAQVSHELTNQ